MLHKIKRKAVSVLFGMGLTACGTSAPVEKDFGTLVFQDEFTTNGPLSDYVVNNPDVLPLVEAKDGRYQAFLEDNTDDKTLHFNQSQGRLDAKKVRFPFTVVVRNIGIHKPDDVKLTPEHSDSTYVFAGLQVHSLNLDERVSSHVVVGHRGSHFNTVEGKNTVNGYSWVTDVGVDKALNGRADILIQGLEDKTLRVFWQVPNPKPGELKDRWIAYNAHAKLPGDAPAYGDEVYVGLITYAQGENGLPFVGTADSLSIYQSSAGKYFK